MTAFLLSAVACYGTNSRSQSRAGDGGSNRSGADAGRHDAGRRVLPYTVTVDLNKIATREVTRGDDGNPVFGKLIPLEGAKACVVKRRKAFAAFQPFEPVDPPICAKSVAGEFVHIHKAPANSDLVMTVEYEGMRPLALTDRTADYDVGVPIGFEGLWFVMLPSGALDPWITATPKPGDHDGLVSIRDNVTWTGDGPARPEVLTSGECLNCDGGYRGATAGGLRVVVEPAGGGDSFEITTARSTELSYASLPEGSARLHFRNDNPRKTCWLLGSGRFDGALAGLRVDVDGTLELPVLAGHDHTAAWTCTCANGPGDGELLDLNACTFAPAADGGDADGG